MSAEYVEIRLPYERWICYLAVSLDLEEIEQYRLHWSSGGKLKDFKWASPDHAGTRPGGVGAGLLEFAKAMSGGKLVKKDVWEYAKATGKQVVYEMAEWDKDTGKFIRKVYVDKDGKEVDTTGYVVVESHHPEAQEEAERVVSALTQSPN